MFCACKHLIRPFMLFTILRRSDDKEGCRPKKGGVDRGSVVPQYRGSDGILIDGPNTKKRR